MMILCKSTGNLFFMQFRRQCTKVFIKLELRKIHVFILQYSFMQLLLLYQKTIHMHSSIGYIGYMRVNKSDIYVNYKHRDIV